MRGSIDNVAVYDKALNYKNKKENFLALSGLLFIRVVYHQNRKYTLVYNHKSALVDYNIHNFHQISG